MTLLMYRFVATCQCAAVCLVLGVAGCTCDKGVSKTGATQSALPGLERRTDNAASAVYKHGLLLALSEFEVGPDGKALAKPKAARLDVLKHDGRKWSLQTLTDAESNVFHKAFVYPSGPQSTIITLGGNAAIIKRWRLEAGAWHAETLWKKTWGGKFNRMRDAEVGELFGDGAPSMAVATHDQGVVAVMRKKANTFEITEIDRRVNTFVHEIELGDLNRDGVLEVYATPSEPNKLDGAVQAGEVVRYVPKLNEGRAVVARFANRHAKEILVRDVDGDGTDELYVSVEAEVTGSGDAIQIKTPVQILRYDANTPPDKGRVIAEIGDRLCRFLTSGDVDGDGKKELIAAAFRSGIWLIRPTQDPNARWTMTRVDSQSSGFEHAALLADLDDDRRDELYVGSDDQGEVRQYRFENGLWKKNVIQRRAHADAFMTWNIMPF